MRQNVEDAEQTDLTRLHESIVQSVMDGVYIVDRARRILFWNAAAERLTGFRAEDVIGHRCADGILRHCDDSGRCLCGENCPLKAVMASGEPDCAHVFLHHADGHRVPVYVRGAPMYDAHGRIIGAIEVFSDDTDRMTALERMRDLERESLIDELTGIANRRYFNRSLHASLSGFERNGSGFGVLMMDIDHFKRFNDTHGHETGDEVLKLVAATLGHGCRANDIPVRWGGEEFAVIADGTDPEGLLVLAERIRNLVASSSLRRPGGDLGVTISIGAAMVREGDDDASLIGRADGALYESKSGGRDRVTLAS